MSRLIINHTNYLQIYSVGISSKKISTGKFKYMFTNTSGKGNELLSIINICFKQ